MEQAVIDIAGKYSFFVIPVIVGILCSFVVAAIDYVTPEKIKGKWLLILTCIVFGILLAFGFPNTVTSAFDISIIATLNVASALLFFHLGGRKLVDKTIKTLIDKFSSKIEGE